MRCGVFGYILGYVPYDDRLFYVESRSFVSSRVVGHPLLRSNGRRHTKCVLRQKMKIYRSLRKAMGQFCSLQTTTSKHTFPVLRPGLRTCLVPSSLQTPSPFLSDPSPCCERDSDSDWTREGVSEPWFIGEEDRDGGSRNRRMAGWFNTAGSLLGAC